MILIMNFQSNSTPGAFGLLRIMQMKSKRVSARCIGLYRWLLSGRCVNDDFRFVVVDGIQVDHICLYAGKGKL